MLVAVLSLGFLFVATILGLFLTPTEAEVQARNFIRPTAGHDDDAHRHNDPHGSHGH